MDARFAGLVFFEEVYVLERVSGCGIADVPEFLFPAGFFQAIADLSFHVGEEYLYAAGAVLGDQTFETFEGGYVYAVDAPAVYYDVL